jgi:hypothetical protein
MAADASNDRDTADAQQQTPSKNKPLRFVTNYGAPHPKRRRIGAACLTCTYKLAKMAESGWY